MSLFSRSLDLLLIIIIIISYCYYNVNPYHHSPVLKKQAESLEQNLSLKSNLKYLNLNRIRTLFGKCLRWLSFIESRVGKIKTNGIFTRVFM